MSSALFGNTARAASKNLVEFRVCIFYCSPIYHLSKSMNNILLLQPNHFLLNHHFHLSDLTSFMSSVFCHRLERCNWRARWCILTKGRVLYMCINLMTLWCTSAGKIAPQGMWKRWLNFVLIFFHWPLK